jgi:nicotinamide mononucleotide transporter
MLTDALFAPAFTLLGQPVTPLEILAFITGAACVWLAVKMNILNWPVGLISVASYSVLFFQAKLYADALLQVVFFAAGVYGWWRWWKVGTTPESRLDIGRASSRQWYWAAGLTLTGVLAVSFYLRAFTDSPLPTLDAAILCISVTALWWQAQKIIECWWLWILVDLISIPVYWTRGLGLTSLLYAIFLIMCIEGLREWRLSLRGARPEGVAA